MSTWTGYVNYVGCDYRERGKEVLKMWGLSLVRNRDRVVQLRIAYVQADCSIHVGADTENELVDMSFVGVSGVLQLLR